MSGHTATAAVDIDASRAHVWATLTEPDRIAAWMGGSRVETSWEVGSPITWTGEHDGRAYEDKGEVLVHDEPSKLSMTHYSPLMGQPDAPESYHTLVYELSDHNGGTRLTLEQDGCDSEVQAEQFSAHWQSMLETLRTGAQE